MSDQNTSSEFQTYAAVGAALKEAESLGFTINWSSSGWIANKEGRNYTGKTVSDLRQFLTVHDAGHAGDDDGDVVYVISYSDSTGGDGIAAVMRKRSAAVQKAWDLASESTRDWAKQEGYPMEGKHYGKEVIRIEYGGEDGQNWIAVERVEVE